MEGQLQNEPTFITYQSYKFLVLDAPTDKNMGAYVAAMQKAGVTDLVRTCDQSYNEEPVRKSGIEVHALEFGDGESPPSPVIRDWMRLVNDVTSRQAAVGVHCVAGLGRAPVLVAVALIEKGMNPIDAIDYIRDRRRGAINRRQLEFLILYRPTAVNRCCQIM